MAMEIASTDSSFRRLFSQSDTRQKADHKAIVLIKSVFTILQTNVTKVPSFLKNGRRALLITVPL
jgi:hypothetical protein